jgi:hypothetical protein
VYTTKEFKSQRAESINIPDEKRMMLVGEEIDAKLFEVARRGLNLPVTVILKYSEHSLSKEDVDRMIDLYREAGWTGSYTSSNGTIVIKEIVT